MKTHRSAEQLKQIQVDLELDMFGSGIARFERNNDRALKEGSASETSWYKRLTREFVSPMAEGIRAYLDYYDKAAGRPARAVSFLQLLPPEVAAYVCIKVVFDSFGVDGNSVQHVASKIGDRIQDQVRFTRLEKAAPKYIEAIKKNLAKGKSKAYTYKHDVMVAGEKRAHSNDKQEYVIELERWQEWTKSDLLHIGMALIEILINSVQYADRPIVQKSTDKMVTSRKGVKELIRLEPSEAIVNWIDAYKDAVSSLSPCYAPCVVQPRDWTRPEAGGYYTPEVATKLPMVKIGDKRHLRKLTATQMPEVYRAINSLQAVKWQINDEVLAVANEVIERDLILGVPSREPMLPREAPIPERLKHLRGKELAEQMTASELSKFKEWKIESSAIYDAEIERRGKYLETIRTIGQAKTYQSFEHIHFVYTLDFRGRIYCQGSLISPQGGDLQKAMLTFAEPKKLGEKGMYWLSVHGANVWGEDKVSFDDRAAFIAGMSEDIRDIAANPLQFKGWTQADKPWQFLSWCFEWASLMEWIEAGNLPEDFESRVAVAMDGSCSGIQHYSAILRDPIGGKAVNLVPSELPQDIYGEVAKVAIKTLEELKDSDKATLEERTLAEQWLSLGINRSLAKKPVMTLPYGATIMSCKDAMYDWLKDKQAKADAKNKAAGLPLVPAHPFAGDGVLPAVDFIANIIWSSIGNVVVAARAGMKYIKDVTKVIAKKGKPLEWETPTGFIVSQKITKREANRVKTQLLGTVYVTLLKETDEIDTRKMQSSCAPNFIHSFDASHLTRAVNYFKDAGIDSIAVIHDSFGTHAGATDTLRKELLQSFVSMYQERNWLEYFKEYNESLNLIDVDVEVPEYMGLDLDTVLDSAYCFA